MNFNRVIFAGNLTRDPEFRDVGEHRVAKFSLAVNNGYGDKRKTMYVDLETWLPGLVKVTEDYLKKGSNVLVEGELHQDDWTDKETGNKRSKLFAKLSSIRLGDKKMSTSNTEQAESVDEPVEVNENNDIPF